MPKFFIPAAESREQAEAIYNHLVVGSCRALSHPAARLYSIAFPQRSRTNPAHVRHCVAVVGREIKDFPERSGIVIAIIGTPELVLIHTSIRQGDYAILVAAEEVGQYVYFDDSQADE